MVWPHPRIDVIAAVPFFTPIASFACRETSKNLFCNAGLSWHLVSANCTCRLMTVAPGPPLRPYALTLCIEDDRAYFDSQMLVVSFYVELCERGEASLLEGALDYRRSLFWDGWGVLWLAPVEGGGKGEDAPKVNVGLRIACGEGATFLEPSQQGLCLVAVIVDQVRASDGRLVALRRDRRPCAHV